MSCLLLWALTTLIVVDCTSKRQLKRQRVADTRRAVLSEGITRSGRIVEKYNLEIISNHYGNATATLVSRLAGFDASNTEHLPNTMDTVFENTVMGKLRLGAPVSISTQSIIYRIQDRDDLLIKYQANCIELDLQADLRTRPYLHPSVTETIYSTASWRLGIGPAIHTLSPPTQLCESMTGKCAFDMPPQAYEICKADMNSSFRYLIMSRVPGSDLGAYKATFPDGIVPMERTFEIGEALIGVLERIHTTGRFVHGDIHMTNVMVESGSPVKLSLIDFGRSFQNIRKQTDRIRASGWSTHPLFSMWEIDGFTPSARDDVARAVELVARLMLPEIYTAFEVLLAKQSWELILRWKREANIFRLPAVDGVVEEEYDPVENLPLVDESTKDLIRGHLAHILSLVRNMTDINGIPPYGALRESIAACRNLTRV